MKLPYVVKFWGILLYIILLGGIYFLFSGRKSENTQFQILLELDSGFYTHMTNFVLSFVLVFISGFMEILMTRKLKNTFFISLGIILINFIYEWYIPILNTLDKVDAYYGFIGSLLPFPFLFILQKFGVKPNPLLVN